MHNIYLIYGSSGQVKRLNAAKPQGRFFQLVTLVDNRNGSTLDTYLCGQFGVLHGWSVVHYQYVINLLLPSQTWT